MSWVDWVWIVVLAIFFVSTFFSAWVDAHIRTEVRATLDEIQSEIRELGALVDAYSEVPPLVEKMANALEPMVLAYKRLPFPNDPHLG